MILQSEYDAEVRHRRLKVFLIVLTTIVVIVVVLVVVRAGKEKAMTPAPMDGVSKESASAPSPEEIQKRLDELSKVPEGVTPPPQPSPEEIQKRLDELSKTPDGETPLPPSQEEIIKRLNELRAKK
jgi:cell division protein FtsN